MFLSQNNFQEQLQRANKELKQVLEDAKGRYVMLSNLAEGVLENQRVVNNDRHIGVASLLDIVIDLHNANVNSKCIFLVTDQSE